MRKRLISLVTALFMVLMLIPPMGALAATYSCIEAKSFGWDFGGNAQTAGMYVVSWSNYRATFLSFAIPSDLDFNPASDTVYANISITSTLNNGSGGATVATVFALDGDAVYNASLTGGAATSTLLTAAKESMTKVGTISTGSTNGTVYSGYIDITSALSSAISANKSYIGFYLTNREEDSSYDEGITTLTNPALTIDVLRGERAAYTVTKEGATCWFGDPRSLHYENAALGINATYVGYIDVHGSIKVTQYDHNTDSVREVLIRSNFQPDDHDNPTFVALPDGRIMVFYSRHTDEARFFYRVSTLPSDVTTFGDEKILAMANNTTYPNPYILENDPDHIYLCWRGINWHPTIGRLTMPDANGDCSFDFGPKQIVSSTVQSSGCRPYAKYCSDGVSRIYMTYTSTHPDNVANVAVYCNYIDIGDGSGNITLCDMAGNVKSTVANGTFAITGYETDPLYVVDSTATSQRGWVWDIALENNAPVVAMVRISSDKQQHNYYCATYDASSETWNKVHLAYAGKYFHRTTGVEQCYSGGMTLNHDNPHEFYASVPVSGVYGSVYEIVKYTMDESFESVASTEYITFNSKKNNVRPVYTRDAASDGKMALTWMRGDYYYWIVNATYPKGYATAIMTTTPLPRAQIDMTAQKVFSDLTERTFSGEAQTLSEQIPSGSFTAAFTVEFDSSYASGTLFSAGDFAIGAERTTLDNSGDTYAYGDGATVLPYISADGVTYESINRLSNSDWMQTHSSTTDGSKGTANMGSIDYALTYDATTGVCETYVNGLLDQHVTLAANLDASGSAAVGSFGGTMKNIALYSRALSQDEIRAISEATVYDALTLPEYVMSDINLASAFSDATPITWTTSDASVIAADGTVARKWNTQYVTLHASAEFEALGSMTKDFEVAVIGRRSAADDMFLHYEFSDGDTYEKDGDTYVLDKTGMGNDALLCGSAQIDGGKLDLTQNSAAGFATNGYLNVATPILKDLHSYSVVTKINLSSNASQPRIYDFGADASHSVFLRANALCAGIKNSSTLIESANTQLSTNTDTLLTVTYDAETRITKVYIDTELVASGTTITHEPYQIGESTRNYIGRTQWWDTSAASSNVDMVGTIDDFRVYCAALSAEDIAAIAQGSEEAAQCIPIEARVPSIDLAYNGAQSVGVVKNAGAYFVFMRADTGYDYRTTNIGFTIKKETGALEETCENLVPNEVGVVGVMLSDFTRPRTVQGFITYTHEGAEETVFSNAVIIDPANEGNDIINVD